MRDDLQYTKSLIEAITRNNSRKEYLDSVVGLIRSRSDCNCVGIRLLNEEGKIPYESYTGFSEGFWKRENWLSVKEDQCVCTRVIMGKPEPQDLPSTTEAGSFCCNNLPEFFDGLPEKDRMRYRGVCVQNGYASIAVIPLNNRGTLTGVIHIADEKPGKVSAEVVEYIESIAPCIAEAVNKFGLEDELVKYRGHLEELVKERTVELKKANEELRREIDGRIHVERNLRESEVRYKEVVDSLQEGIFEMDARGVITFGNKRAYDLFGYTEEDFENGISAVQALVPEDRERILDNILNSLVEENVGINEYMAQRKDGSKFSIMIHSCPVIREGRPVGLRGTIIDITERKRMEGILEFEREQMLSIFSSINQIIYVSDLNTYEVLYANKAAQDLFGKKLVSGACYREFHGFEYPCEFCTNEIILKNNGNPHQWEYYHPHLDRHLIIVDRIIKWPDGRDVRFGFAMDVTPIKEAEKAYKQSYEILGKALDGAVNALAAMAEKRDPYTSGHQNRVAELACQIANKMRLPEEQIEGIRVASILHDIGKIYIPTDILNKPNYLVDIERTLIQTHPQVGFDIVKAIPFKMPIGEIIIQHHERIDGSGYPQGLSGNEIILEARILAVADVVEAMASHRPYRPALGVDMALREISEKSGVLYDSRVVEACLSVFSDTGHEYKFRQDGNIKSPNLGLLTSNHSI